MEACGSAYRWARWLLARGFRVKLMAPRAVKAYRAGVQTANQLRGRLSEFGIVLPKRHTVLLTRLGEITASGQFGALPAVVRELVERLRAEIVEQAEKAAAAEAMLSRRSKLMPAAGC
jgi:transposase